MSTYTLAHTGPSRSFPTSHAFLEQAQEGGEALVVLGGSPGALLQDRQALSAKRFVAVELGTECLAVYGGLEVDEGLPNLVGFARFRLGCAEPSALIELVRQPWTTEAATDAARAAFKASGFVVALCEDVPGRIVDRLVRPYYNAALRRLDDGLASAQDMDKTLRLGLGYPEGPIELLKRTGLAAHFDVTQALHQALGQEPYAPARMAQVAKARAQTGA